MPRRAHDQGQMLQYLSGGSSKETWSCCRCAACCGLRWKTVGQVALALTRAQ